MTDSIAKAYVGLTEGKFVDPFLPSGKPNPNHPAYKQHKATYDADRKAIRQANVALKAKAENPISMHHIDAAIGNAYPDVDPYEHLAVKFPDLHSKSKLYDMLDSVVKKNTPHKTFSEYVDSAFSEYDSHH